MAYGASVLITSLGAGKFVVDITESDVAAADEAAITGLPGTGRIIRQQCTLVSGAGATVDPIIGRTANPAGITVILENGTAAATCDNQPIGGACFAMTSGLLFHRSVPNAGADNVVHTRYLVQSEWA